MMSAKVKVEKDSDHTSYYVVLVSTLNNTQMEQIPVYPPRWDAQSLTVGSQAQVYKDPVSGKILVVEIEGKLLWSMAL